MSNLAQFSAEEVYDIAIQTERNGRAFYEAVAAGAREPRIARLMHLLAEAERNHETIFRMMKEESPGHAPRESYAGETLEYINSLLFARVLPDVGAGLKLVAGMKDEREALDFALGFEKDTILFLYGMKEVVSAQESAKVEALIAQEMGHVRLLTQLKRDLTPHE